MCGIAGIVDSTLNGSEIQATMRRMTDVIVHRGPDDAGLVCEPGMGIGMRRLSIIDVAGGQQPIANESGDIHVICNGEIYNFEQLRSQLEGRGHRFSTGSDAEAIVHLYEDYGQDCIRHLRGMFGLAIWDQRQQRLLLARDRLGKKPLFYAQLGDRLVFGSEMKSLLAAYPQLSRPNYRTLGQFFQFAYIHQPETIYSGIARLPAGHLATYSCGQLSIEPYWQLEFEPDDGPAEAEWCQRLDEALRDAVQARLHSEVPLGVFLSGGLDSSAVVAYAHEAGLKPLKTFTIGFDRAEWDESDDARRVAEHFGTEHHLLRISEADLRNSFETTLQSVIAHCDEPFGDASAIPTYHVSRLAREHVTVILSGDGGDELFAGYSSYRGALFAQQYRRYLPFVIGRHVLPTVARGAAGMLPGKWHYQALRAAKVCRDSALPIERAYRDKTSIWNVAELRQLLHPEVFAQAEYLGEQYLPDPLWARMRGDRDLVSRLTEVDIHSYMLDDILVKVDRMSMAHSLEVRSPLLDHHVVELAARIPTRMKIRGGSGKHILRQVIKDKLPAKTIRKGKQGFSVPLRDWFRGPLSELVHDYLGPGGYLPHDLFEQRQVETLLGEHRRGGADHANKIWLLLTFAAWHRQYQSGEGESASRLSGAGSRQPLAGQTDDREAMSCES